MKNFFLIISICSMIVLSNCKGEPDKPKVTYNIPKKVNEQTIDTTKIAVADLPIQFESTNYLIYPIGNLNVSENSGKSGLESKSEEPVNYIVENHLDNEITGYLQNLKFQKIDSDSLVSLTNKPMLIQTVNFLSTIANKTKKQILVYLVADADTNEDGRLDTNDIKSLYLSDISGNKFTKISTDVQEILDWKIIESKNRLYFRAIEDSNKNGKFDKNDKLHYNYINLIENEWKALEFSVI